MEALAQDIEFGLKCRDREADASQLSDRESDIAASDIAAWTGADDWVKVAAEWPPRPT
jgi:hypothetical protein